jgi:fructokinase
MTVRYMAHALMNLTCVLSPRRIVLGGSVRKGGLLGEERFFQRLRGAFREVLAGYIQAPPLTEAGLEQYLVPPELGDEAGVCGALALAHDAWAEHQRRSAN